MRGGGWGAGDSHTEIPFHIHYAGRYQKNQNLGSQEEVMPQAPSTSACRNFSEVTT